MGAQKVTDYFVYRYRYTIGLVGISVLLIALVIGSLFFPGGISHDEIQSVTTSTNTSLGAVKNFEYVVDLPYHALQRISVHYLGTSLVGIKLPSIIMAITGLGALFGVLAFWFRRNGAIFSAFVIATSTVFLITAQGGTPAIMVFFWSSMILFFATLLTYARKYKFLIATLLLLCIGFSLYTPFQIYLVIALVVTALIHPHVRTVIYKRKWSILALAIVGSGIFLTPLIIACINTPHTIVTLLGIPTSWQPGVWLANLKTLVVFQPPNSQNSLYPAFNFGILLLMFVGLYRLFTVRYTARSYFLTTWCVFLVPLAIVSPNRAPILMVPVFILVGKGAKHLINSWYRLFPHSPYARAAGLIPLAIVLVGLMSNGLERFIYGYHYNAFARASYSQDSLLLKRAMPRLASDKTVYLLVAPEQREFYKLVTKHSSYVVVGSIADIPANTPTVVSAHYKPDIKKTPTKVLVDDRQFNSDRFYFYKNS